MVGTESGNNRCIATKVDTLENLERYVAMARDLKRAQFVAAHAYPFLVHVAAGARLEDNPWEEKFAFSTEVGDHEGEDDEDDDVASDAPRTARVIVAPVRKREGGLFAQRIGVGRARNCDVVLRFPSVSKLHAQFLVNGAEWSLMDVDSANGTTLNGAGLVPYKAIPVKIGDRLRLGEIEVEFAEAAGVFDRLRLIRP